MKKNIIAAIMFSLFIPLFSFAAGAVKSDCVNLQNSNLRSKARDISTKGEVSILQNFLFSQKYLNSKPTGTFGPLTEKAVKDFQKANSISQTGTVGPLTRARINEISKNLCVKVVAEPIPVPIVIAPLPIPVVPAPQATPPVDSTPVTVDANPLPASGPLLGDANLDGVINSADEQLVTRYVSGSTQLSSSQRLNADTNKDGRISRADYLLIRQYIAGQISAF